MLKQQNNEDSVNSIQPSNDTVVVSKDSEIEIGENGDTSQKSSKPEPLGEEGQVKAPEQEKTDCVIDVERAEKVCRICHLSSENSELIGLGCGCKDELGVSHLHCAQTWFKHKGNRQCEICGKPAKNITGIEDLRIFRLEWNETRLTRTAENPSDRVGSCQCRKSCCNLLLACLVLVFVLPWFFRVNML